MKNLLQINLGRRVKELRTKTGLSQEQFALKIGMDRTYLASIENGMRNVTIFNLARMAEGFGMTLSEFLQPFPRIRPRDLEPLPDPAKKGRVEMDEKRRLNPKYGVNPHIYLKNPNKK